MAIYNNGFPMGYPQYSYPQAQQITMPSAKNGINWVQGEAGARSFWVNPNESVLLMDSEKDCFYIKSVDASGVPLPLRIFDYSERKAEETVPPQAAQDITSTQIDTSMYMTREEVEQYVQDAISGLAEKKTAKKG